MTVQINYKNWDLKKTASNLVLFVGENFQIGTLNKHISKSELSYISDLLKTSDLKKDILSFKINSKKTIFLVSVKKYIKISELENLGAKFHSFLKNEKNREYFVNSNTILTKINNNTKALNLIGLCYFKEKKYEESFKYLFKGLSIDEKDISILNSIAAVYYETRDLKKSEEFYLKALSYEPDSYRTLNNIAGYYLEINKSKKAILFYKVFQYVKDNQTFG